MTVKELRDKLDQYIKTDPEGWFQLNDIELDRIAYQERCKERGERRIVIVDDGMISKYFDINKCFGITIDVETKPAVVEMLDRNVGENDNPETTTHMIKKVPVQIQPAQYKQENVFGLISNLTYPIP